MTCFEIVHAEGRLRVSSRIEGIDRLVKLLRQHNPAIGLHRSDQDEWM